MTPTKAEELSDWLFAFASGKAESIMLCRAAAELRRLSAVEAERDALLDALNDAAQSLTTIAENAGRSLNTDGTENYLFHFDQVRGYARSRAGVAIDAARATGEHHE